MKLPYIIFALFCAGTTTFGQTDTYQRDSVYKVNRVKERTMQFVGQGSKAKIITRYNQQGMITEFLITDNETGKKPQGVTRYFYNANQQLVSDTSVSNDTIDAVSQYMYNTAGKLLKKSTFDIAGILASETIYSYDPDIETEIFYFNDGSIRRKQTSFYEAPNVSYKFTGFSIEENGDTSKWDYDFKNVFDMNKKLIKRIEKFYQPNKQVQYEYNDKDLLIRRTEILGKNNMVARFTYKYW